MKFDDLNLNEKRKVYQSYKNIRPDINYTDIKSSFNSISEYEDGYSVSDEIVKFIKNKEGFRSKVYKDGKGLLTIGYGSRNPEFLNAGYISESDASKEMMKHIDREILPYLSKQNYWDNLNQSQKDSLVSYAYNVGAGSIINNHPKLTKALNNKDWQEAARQIDAGYNDTENPGLKTRRDQEREIFLRNINNGNDFNWNQTNPIKYDSTGFPEYPTSAEKINAEKRTDGIYTNDGTFIPDKWMNAAKGTLIDNNKKPSTDNRTSQQRNKDYWSPIKGATDRWNTSVDTETNPFTSTPLQMLMAAPVLSTAGVTNLVTSTAGALVGNEIANQAVGPDYENWSDYVEENYGVPKLISDITNPGALVGGFAGNKIATPLRSFYYNNAPWTWKPNPDNFYRVGTQDIIDDALMSGIVRQKPTSNQTVSGINLNRGSGAKAGQTYFNKSKPLSSKYGERYGKQVSNYGDYIIEANSTVPFVQAAPKGRLGDTSLQNNEIVGSAIPRSFIENQQPLIVNENVNLLKPSWIYGFKKVNK